LTELERRAGSPDGFKTRSQIRQAMAGGNFLLRREAGAGIPDVQLNAAIPVARADANLAATVLHAVFHQRLETEWWNLNVLQFSWNLDRIIQPRPESCLLDFQVIGCDFQFVFQRHRLAIGRIERKTKERGQP